MLITRLLSLLLERYVYISQIENQSNKICDNLRSHFILFQSFRFVSQVNPVTHAVGNTIKRVVIIVASVVAFKTPMSTGSIIGSSIAIFGTLLYSLAMNASKK